MCRSKQCQATDVGALGGACWCWPSHCNSLIWSSPQQTAQQSLAANVTGTVELEGKAIPKAIVVFAPEAPKGRVITPVHAITDADGSFSASGLLPERQAICVYTPLDDVVNPCVWGTEMLQSPGLVAQQSASMKIQLKRGTPLRIRINDPDGLIASMGHPERTGAVVVGVWNNGIFFSARRLSEDSSGAEFLIVVPTGSRVRPYVGAQGAVLVE